jgi:hypothetical protein
VQLPIPNSVTGSTDEEKIRTAILDLVGRGKPIEGKFYPYSPSSAGAGNERAILADAIAAAEAAIAPREWSPGDLEALVKTALKQLQKEGTLVVRELTDLVEDRGRFRKGRGLKVSQVHTQNGGPDAADLKPSA